LISQELAGGDAAIKPLTGGESVAFVCAEKRGARGSSGHFGNQYTISTVSVEPNQDQSAGVCFHIMRRFVVAGFVKNAYIVS
jgi:hypothetical protein